MGCTTGQKGINLQLRAENQTEAIEKEIISKAGRFGVPAIVFNKVKWSNNQYLYFSPRFNLISLF